MMCYPFMAVSLTAICRVDTGLRTSHVSILEGILYLCIIYTLSNAAYFLPSPGTD